MYPDGILVRPYRPIDEKAVRDIACDTADMGEPVENFFADREIVADLLTGYYTRYEPGALWVAEHEGKVIGYLTGCLDTRRHMRISAFCLIPRILIKSILRPVFLRKDGWRFFKSAIKTACLGGFRRLINLDKYPAHLHINIQKEFRGQHVGRRLMEQFIEQVRIAGLPGIHVATKENNMGARKFFESFGFIKLSRYPVVYRRKGDYSIVYAISYGKDIKRG